MKTVTIGGERLGSGKKMKTTLNGFERSTHDLSYTWRSTMAPGTLVPFYQEIALPGDTFDIDLTADIKTYPTLGALFGSFKMQMDVFLCPMRLYNALLHNNKLNIGLKMENVKFPQIELRSKKIKGTSSTNPVETFQIDQSSLLAYLGIRGVGNSQTEDVVIRKFNAMGILSYYDIYKNYYANKQEKKGAIISARPRPSVVKKIEIIERLPRSMGGDKVTGIVPEEGGGTAKWTDNLNPSQEIRREIKITGENLFLENIKFYTQAQEYKEVAYGEVNEERTIMRVYKLTPTTDDEELERYEIEDNHKDIESNLKIQMFDLENIDKMREELLKHTYSFPYELNNLRQEPYLSLYETSETGNLYSKGKQNGLALKTYLSDMFNNFLSEEAINASNGIAQVTAIDTSSGKLNIDTLIIAKKVYDMLNRVAISGGSYQDWVEAVYDIETFQHTETPVFLGGMSQEVVFQQVVSNAQTEGQPLGSLAGRGELLNNKRGGKITVKVTEPSILMGIVSLTPRIDYSQGNAWFNHLQTMDDLHKPSLDQIGFQPLITEEMAYWETNVQGGNTERYSAGYLPAWMNYMTSYNKCYGEFANPSSEMFMTLNRRYEFDEKTGRIKDLTTYIDPKKFNHIFAVTDLSAQNFMVQIACDITARRKMSAKIIPNL